MKKTDLDEQRRKHDEIGPHWWVYEIFPKLTKKECDKMIKEWEVERAKKENESNNG